MKVKLTRFIIVDNVHLPAEAISLHSRVSGWACELANWGLTPENEFSAALSVLNKQAHATAGPIAEILAKRQRLEALVDADGDEEDSESSDEEEEEEVIIIFGVVFIEYLFIALF